MLVYGHRGTSEIEPENTLSALRRAISDGADGTEFDVQCTSDGIPVVLHDRLVDRTTNGTGPIDQLTWRQARALVAGRGEHIPTLEEALTLIGSDLHLDIELKQPAIEATVLNVLATFPEARWSISSFDWTTLQRCRWHAADADLWLLATHVSDALFAMANEIAASGVALRSRSLTAETAVHLHAAGLKIMCWTVNDVTEARRVRDLGADAICTDNPGRLRDELRRG